MWWKRGAAHRMQARGGQLGVGRTEVLDTRRKEQRSGQKKHHIFTIFSSTGYVIAIEKCLEFRPSNLLAK